MANVLLKNYLIHREMLPPKQGKDLVSPALLLGFCSLNLMKKFPYEPGNTFS